MAAAALASDPNEISQSDLGRPSDSSILHSRSDMMLHSAVKLASESSFKERSGTLEKKKKKKKKRKAQGQDFEYAQAADQTADMGLPSQP